MVGWCSILLGVAGVVGFGGLCTVSCCLLIFLGISLLCGLV